jgi:hypothetical protein
LKQVQEISIKFHVLCKAETLAILRSLERAAQLGMS